MATKFIPSFSAVKSDYPIAAVSDLMSHGSGIKTLVAEEHRSSDGSSSVVFRHYISIYRRARPSTVSSGLVPPLDAPIYRELYLLIAAVRVCLRSSSRSHGHCNNSTRDGRFDRRSGFPSPWYNSLVHPKLRLVPGSMPIAPNAPAAQGARLAGSAWSCASLEKFMCQLPITARFFYHDCDSVLFSIHERLLLRGPNAQRSYPVDIQTRLAQAMISEVCSRGLSYN